MNSLVASLTPVERDNLLILERTIEQSVIPPFLHKWCFFIMGNFKQSHVPGSPMLKIMPWHFKDVGAVGPPNVNASVFTELYTTSAGFGMITNAVYLLNEHRGMQDILARAYPDWCNPQLLMYNSLPEFDPNYLQFWKNAFYMCGGLQTTDAGSIYITKKLPEVAAITDEAIYCADTDAPDGWIQAMQCIYSSTASKVGPGFFSGTYYVVENDALSNPVVKHAYAAQTYVQNAHEISSTCTVYDGSTTSVGYRDVGSSGSYQKLAQNVYSSTIAATATKKHQQFGTSLMKLQNFETIRQACFGWYDLVASDLKTPSKSRSSSRSRSYKGKGKSKSKDEDMSDK
jgi:hypothetical protein